MVSIMQTPPFTIPAEGDEVRILDQWGNITATVIAEGPVVDPHDPAPRVIGWHDVSGNQYWFGFDIWETV